MKLLNSVHRSYRSRTVHYLSQVLALIAILGLASGTALAKGEERRTAPLGKSQAAGSDDTDDSADRDAREKLTKTLGKKKSPLSASLLWSTAMGLGSLVPGYQQQVDLSTALVPTLSYKISKKMSLAASIGATVYAINPYTTALPNGTVLLSDLHFTLGHSSIFKSKKQGFNLSTAFRVYFPTSLASRFQNRIMTMRPSFTGSFKLGKVSISFTTMFAKYFGTSSVPSIDCDGYDAGYCREGRPAGPSAGGGFESERQGGEVFLPGYGATSFYFGNSLAVSWKIMEGLTLAGSATVYNLFGIRSYDEDEFSSANAKEGRSQTDRLITSIGLSYRIIKQLSVGLSWTTDTVRPFGADGKDLVIFDTERAPDNISSLSLSFTGSL